MTSVDPSLGVTTSVIGKDFAGNDVVATFTKTSHNTQVRFEGVVKPTFASDLRPWVELFQDASGAWYVDSALVAPGFRFDGGWDMPFNAPGLQGKRRLFQSREELATVLRDGGYQVAEPELAPGEVPAPSRPLVASLRSVAAAGAALTAHTDALGLEGDDRTLLWHLLASLNELAAAQRIDLDEVFNDVRQSIEKGDMNLPAARAALRQHRSGK